MNVSIKSGGYAFLIRLDLVYSMFLGREFKLLSLWPEGEETL